MKPSSEQLREHFAYDPATGILTWKKPRSSRIKVGDLAGTTTRASPTSTPRRAISIFGHRYYAANVIWCMVTGAWPAHLVDHKDGDSLNDRWRNLRPATHLQNQQNQRRPLNNVSGIKGVSFHASRGKWIAQILVAGKHHWLGRFDTREAAAAAYTAAEIRLRGEFRRSNPDGRQVEAG